MLSGGFQVYVSRPSPRTLIPVLVVATGVPAPLSGAPEAATEMVAPLTPVACPLLTFVSNWTISSTVPPGKTSELAFANGDRVGIG